MGHKMCVKSIFWTLVVGFLRIAEAGVIGDQCDWNGSGLSQNAERAVTPVYLRCREGSLTWQYPRGALRLLFRPSLPASDRDFRVCIRVLRRPDPPDLFHIYRHNETEAERFPARLFVEGAQRLVPLYAADDGDPRELRCFRSKRGPAALYVEADPELGPARRVASLQYEARPLPRRQYDPATADCRPCTDAEMELAFCTSDLVSRGRFTDTEQRDDLDSTQLTLKVTKLIRVIGGDGRDPREPNANHLDVNDDKYDTDNDIEERTYGKRRIARSVRLHAHVHVPAECGAAGGAGEFLVMARRRLGRLAMVCAPRIEDWVKLVEARNADGNAHCLLQH